MTSLCPISQARNSGVCFMTSRASTMAPFSSSSCTVLTWPDRAAACSAVQTRQMKISGAIANWIKIPLRTMAFPYSPPPFCLHPPPEAACLRTVGKVNGGAKQRENLMRSIPLNPPRGHPSTPPFILYTPVPRQAQTRLKCREVIWAPAQLNSPSHHLISLTHLLHVIHV